MTGDSSSGAPAIKTLANRLGPTARAIAILMSLYHLYIAFAGPPEVVIFRGTHLAFALVLIFLSMPASRTRPSRGVLWLDAAFLILSVASIGYLFVNYDYVVTRFPYVDEPTVPDLVFGIALTAMILEGSRRVLGPALPITAVLFLVYALAGPYLPFGLAHGGVSIPELVDHLYLTTDGIFGIPLGVSATFVVLFVLFGAFVERVGTGHLFVTFAQALTGHTPGGPAKVACITSGLFGTISGSAVSNVMTTGTLTIPLMKKIGYRPAFAGAVEAVSSTGGQIMPPIMGAAAFVMAEFLGVAFQTVALYALVPAVLFYLAVFLAIHFEAKRTGLRGLSKSELPELGPVLRKRGHQFIPLAVVVAVLIMGYSPPMAALAGILAVVPIALLRTETRREVSVRMVGDALETGARNALAVAAACACAGIVIGVISLTGLGLAFTTLVLDAAQDLLLPALVLTMLAGIILGMGMPTTPAYIMQVALLVPALVKLGIPQPAAHMFVFYFAIMSAITPPVAMAVFAASSISRAGLWESSVAAVKLGATGYLVPFFFVFGPSLLLIGEPFRVVTTVVTAVLGVTCLASGLHGWFLTNANWWQRGMLLAASVILIKPGLMTDAVGLSLLAAVVVIQLIQRRQAIRAA